MNVALVTCSKVANLATDDVLLLPVLTAYGIHVQPVVWDNSSMDWSIPSMSVIRSTRDYHHRLPAFLSWAEHVATLSSLWNPIDLIRWNTHKAYLRDLEQQGVPIIPTTWLTRGSAVNLTLLMDAWSV